MGTHEPLTVLKHVCWFNFKGFIFIFVLLCFVYSRKGKIQPLLCQHGNCQEKQADCVMTQGTQSCTRSETRQDLGDTKVTVFIIYILMPAQ